MKKTWTGWFQPHILERGRCYYEDGRVSELERTEDGYTAVVDGSEEYDVEILLDGETIEDMLCDCPYAEGGSYCKHMAAVLFAIESKKPTVEKSTAGKSNLSPAALVERIPEEQLRSLLTELATADEQLYNSLLLQYGGTSLDECVKTLKKELAAIDRKYTDRSGYIDYGDAYDFSCDTADYIRHQTDTLLKRGEPLLAFQMGMDALRDFCGYDMDDSDGGYSLVLEAMDELCYEVLSTTDEDIAEKVFELLSICTKTDHSNWMVCDFAEQTIFSHFSETSFTRKKLEMVDGKLAALEEQGSGDYNKEYEIERLLVLRFDLMGQLSMPQKELDAFLERYGSYHKIRNLRVKRFLDAGKVDDAISLLEEGKTADEDKHGYVAEYSRQLIDLYDRLGRHDAMLAELEYHIFTLSTGGLEMLGRLKKACTPDQWVEYREQYLSKPHYDNLELMESEELWDRLMQAVADSGWFPTIDRFEKTLKKRYPDRMREAYADLLTAKAKSVSDRKQYRDLIQYLKKLKGYPSGAERASQIADDWRVRYKRRTAMMDELRSAGF